MATSMNKKNEVSISTKRRRHVVLRNAFTVIGLAVAIAGIITAKAGIFFVIAYGQDLNPPTTGKTSPHVTSTFGPNIPGRANGSSTIGNGTQGNFSNSIAGQANGPK
jgi:hypothetical protein